MIISAFTGHMYRNSPYESDSDCGNCNGARCDTCTERFRSTKIDGEIFRNKQEAEDAEKEYENLIFCNDSLTLTFFIRDNKLYCTIYNDGHIDIECNRESSIYEKVFNGLQRQYERYNEIKCESESCIKYGCLDLSCYRDIKNNKSKQIVD